MDPTDNLVVFSRGMAPRDQGKPPKPTRNGSEGVSDATSFAICAPAGRAKSDPRLRLDRAPTWRAGVRRRIAGGRRYHV